MFLSFNELILSPDSLLEVIFIEYGSFNKLNFPVRIPVPELWIDILQKVKAAG